jgi:urease accessory protein UreF
MRWRTTRMSSQSKGIPRHGSGLAGDPRALAGQLGSAEGIDTYGKVLASQLSSEVRDLETLRQFLRNYVTCIVVAADLPTVHRAFEHTCRYEIRELITLDRQLSLPQVPDPFAEASRRVGRSQLRRLRPLLDDRRVQRYWRSVEARQAPAWHTVVYGLTMAVFSFPLRQALVNYGHQTVRGFVDSAGTRLALKPADCDQLCTEVAVELRPAVDAILAGMQAPQLPERG